MKIQIDFRKDIANELSRDELIERLCDMHKHYVEMRKEWFAVCQLGEKPTIEPKPDTSQVEENATDEDIENAAKDYIDELDTWSDLSYPQLIHHGYIDGAKDMRDKKIYISPK